MEDLGTPAVLAIFVVASAATWFAGLALSDTTDQIDARFNLGEALGGLLLLGIAGTLPEIAITASAAVSGEFAIASGNLLGGIGVQTLVLVLLDLLSRSTTPLSSMSKVLEPILEAIFVIILVSLALMGPLLPESVAIGPVSPISLTIAVMWFFGLLTLNRLRTNERWRSVERNVEATMAAPTPGPVEGVKPNRYVGAGTRTVIAVFAVAAVVTLVAGVALEQSGTQLANAWGINGVLFGATILAGVTALPEISTGIRAVRLGEVGLAMGDIFGGNQVQMTLFLLADILAGQPVLHGIGASSIWLGGIGVIMTAVFAGGLIMRPQRKLAGLGPDSWLAVAFYVFGLLGLVRLAS